MLGPILALLSSITFALKHIFIRRASLKIINTNIGTLVSVPTAFITLLVILIVNGQIRLLIGFPAAGYFWFALAGVLQFTVGLSIYYKCIQLMGANLAILLSRINILVSVAIGILFLHEPVSVKLLVGVSLIFMGVTLPGLNTPMLRDSDGSLLNIPFKAYVLVFISGFIFGVTPIFIKLGISKSGYPIVGAFISFLAGTIAMCFLFIRQENRVTITKMDTKSLILFLLSGIIFCVGNLFRFFALKMTSASIAVPLISTMPVFLIFFSFIFNRKIEIFNRKVVMGAVSVVLGTILVF